MKPGIVRQPLPLIIVTYLIVTALVLLRTAVTPHPTAMFASGDMPLGQLIDSAFGSAMAGNIFSLFIYFVCAVLINRLIVGYSVSPVRTYLPLIIFAVFSYGIFLPTQNPGIALAVLLLVYSTILSIASFRRAYTFSRVFKSAFCLGIIPLLYSPAAVLLLMMPITLALYRRTPREAVTALAGVVAPMLICSVGWWMCGESWNHILISLAASIQTAGEPSLWEALAQSGPVVYAFASLYITIILWSVILLVRNYQNIRVRVKKIYQHSIYLLILIIAMAFLPSGGIPSLIFAAIPASILSTLFFTRTRNSLSLSVYILLIASIIAINIIPYIS